MRLILVALIVIVPAVAVSAVVMGADLRGLAADYLVMPHPPQGGRGVVIAKSVNRLYLFQDGRVHRRYRVATGREEHFTPEGSFAIVNRLIDPGDPRYGSRWLGIGVPASADRRLPVGDPRAPEGRKYGLHGTDEPETIGGHFSGGCVRLKNSDIEELYELLELGARVEIRR